MTQRAKIDTDGPEPHGPEPHGRGSHGPTIDAGAELDPVHPMKLRGPPAVTPV